MQQIILNTQNPADFLLIIQLAKRLGISYIARNVEVPTNLSPSIKKGELPENIQKLAKPLRKTWNLAEIKQEQNYTNMN